MPHGSPDHRRGHRQYDTAGDSHQQPPHSGKAGPGRAVVVDGPELHEARQERPCLPQGQVHRDPVLEPLVQGQKRRPQGGKNRIQHEDSPFCIAMILFSVHAFPRKCNQNSPEASASGPFRLSKKSAGLFRQPSQCLAFLSASQSKKLPRRGANACCRRLFAGIRFNTKGAPQHRRGSTVCRPLWPANRAASSKPPRFFRHRRRFGAFPLVLPLRN